MAFDPSSAQPLDFDPGSAQPAPEAAPAPTGRVAQLLNVPSDERDPAKRRAWAEAEAQKEQQREPPRQGGILGAIQGAFQQAIAVRDAIDTAAHNTVFGLGGHVAGLAQGGNRLVQAGLSSLVGDKEGAARYAEDVVPAYNRGAQSMLRQPPTEASREILEGPVMRAVNDTMNALGPTGPMAINPRVVMSPQVAQATKVGARAAADAALTPVRNVQAAKAARATEKAKLEAPENQGIVDAIENGFKVTPHAGKAGSAAQAAQSVAGSAPLERALSAHNSENGARLVREDLGLPADVPLTRDAAIEIRKVAGGDYAAVKDVGRIKLDSQLASDLDQIASPYVKGGKDFDALAQNPIIKTVEGLRKTEADTASIIEVVKDLRNKSDVAGRAGDKKLAGDYRAAAAALDNAMDRALNKASPDLTDAVSKYRAARVRIAKSYLAEEAMDGKPGEINLNVYARAQKKGVFLDGPAKAIADFARQFGEEGLTKKKGRTANTNMTYGDIVLGALLHGPLGIVGGAAGLGRAATRKGLASDLMQRRMAAKARKALPPTEPPTPREGPAPLELAPEGALPPPSKEGIPPSPLGDLTPDWETAPGARPDAAALEVVPTEGLVPAAGEPTVLRNMPKTPNTSEVGPVRPMVREEPPRPAPQAGAEIPAVPGRPDLPDVMVAGAPAEVAATEAMGAATLAPEAQLAMRTQQTDRNVAAANAERAQPVPAGEATEIKPQVVEPAGAPKVKEPTPEKLPVGEATEIKPQAVEPAKAPRPVDVRLAEIERLTAATDSPVVRKALEKRAAAVKKELADEAAATKRREDAAELRRTAALTEDADIKAALFEEAKKIEKADAVPAAKAVEGQPEIKVNKPKELPKPKVVEGQPEIKVKKEEKLPTPETKELGPDGEVLADLDLPKLDEAFMAEQQRAQEPKVDPKLQERGRRQTRAALEKGIADGSIGKDEGELALWALDRNPNLSRGLRLEVSKAADGDNARAVYKSAERVVEIFKNRESDPTRAAHEILHHSERMMPPEVQRGIRREWRRAIDVEMKKATPEVREALGKITEGLNGGRAAFEEMKQAFKDGVLDREKHYHLTNPSEFWAVNATRILSERHAGRNAWRTRAVQWVREMVEHVKSKVGLRSDAPVLKALNEVMDAQKNAGVERSTGTLKTAEVQATLADRLRANKNSTEEK
ncbi:MAG: Erwinia phage PEp14 [Pseudomonadota bacterium]|jgi:hypothetical protein